MKCIEYRYTQAINTLKAVVQLGTDGKYWNDAKGKWQADLSDACKMRLVELSAANVYNSNIDEFDFMTLYKDRIEDGLYVTASKFLSIAPGALYSVHIYNDDKLISTTTRYEGSSMHYFDMIKEVLLADARMEGYAIQGTINKDAIEYFNGEDYNSTRIVKIIQQ